MAVTPSLVDAAAHALSSPDLLLCSPQQAEDFGLHWCTLADPRLQRGYDIAAGAHQDLEQLRTALHADIARCLGAPADPGGVGGVGGRLPDKPPTREPR